MRRWRSEADHAEDTSEARIMSQDRSQAVEEGLQTGMDGMRHGLGCRMARDEGWLGMQDGLGSGTTAWFSCTPQIFISASAPDTLPTPSLAAPSQTNEELKGQIGGGVEDRS